MGYLCANFSLPRPLCSRLRPNVRDRQTDVRRVSSLNASALWGRGIIIITCILSIVRYQSADLREVTVTETEREREREREIYYCVYVYVMCKPVVAFWRQDLVIISCTQIYVQCTPLLDTDLYLHEYLAYCTKSAASIQIYFEGAEAKFPSLPLPSLLLPSIPSPPLPYPPFPFPSSPFP